MCLEKKYFVKNLQFKCKLREKAFTNGKRIAYFLGNYYYYCNNVACCPSKHSLQHNRFTEEVTQNTSRTQYSQCNTQSKIYILFKMFRIEFNIFDNCQSKCTGMGAPIFDPYSRRQLVSYASWNIKAYILFIAKWLHSKSKRKRPQGKKECRNACSMHCSGELAVIYFATLQISFPSLPLSLPSLWFLIPTLIHWGGWVVLILPSTKTSGIY